MNTPNHETRKAMQDIREKRNLKHAKDATEMFNHLGIQYENSLARVTPSHDGV